MISLYSWGYNYYGQLGIGNTSNRSSPVSVASTFIRASTYNNALAITSTGALYVWGNNSYNKLGIPGGSSQSIPTAFPYPKSFSDMSTGSGHSLGIDIYGGVWGWGNNGSGQLGNNSSSNPSSYVQVSGHSFSKVAAGPYHSLGIDKSTGQVYAWGYDSYYGNLGQNTQYTNRSSPVAILKAGSFKCIAAGYSSSYAVDSSGRIWSWGGNGYGSLGDGTKDYRSSPVSVIGPTLYTKVVAGSSHALGLGTDGQVWAWGFNGNGQLGLGTSGFGTEKSSPVMILRVGSYIDIVAGAGHSLALDHTGTLWAWGNNYYGQLGTGNTVNTSSPVSIAGVFTSIYGGDNNSYGIGFVYIFEVDFSASVLTGGIPLTVNFTDTSPEIPDSWDWDFGDGSPHATNQNPTHTYNTAGLYTVILTGVKDSQINSKTKTDYIHVGPYATLYSWGGNYNYQLGIGYVGDRSIPTRVAPNFIKASVNNHALAITSTGKLYVWGSNAWDKTGIPGVGDVPIPTAFPYPKSFSDISAGGTFSLGIEALTGRVYAWGNNSYGQLGDGTENLPNSYTQVLGHSFSKISAGTGHSLGIDRSTGQVYAWGSDEEGALGQNTSWVNRSSPVAILKTGSFKDIYAGDFSSYAIDSNGHMWSWGINWHGQLGDGTQVHRSSPVSVVGSALYTKVASGGGHALALGTDGQVWAWGKNSNGQLGLGTSGFEKSSPVMVPELGSCIDIGVGRRHSLAVKYTGTLWAWGYNDTGQLGNGTVIDAHRPVLIAANYSKVYGSGLQPYCDTVSCSFGISHNFSGIDFFGDVIEGSSPLTVHFEPISEFTLDSYEWSFGDGTSSTQRSPTHTYYSKGSYTVSLLATYGFSARTIKLGYIVVGVSSDFSGSPLSGRPPLTVSFTEGSGGEPTNFLWDFGDGFSSSDKDPSHTYIRSGRYTVKLDVQGYI